MAGKYSGFRKWYWQESRIIFFNSGLRATYKNNKTGCPISFEENKYHTNEKELLAAKFALSKFVNIEKTHVKLISNSPATVYGINNKGCNKSDLCHQIIFGFWITAAYVPGKENLDTGGESSNKQKIWNGCFTEKFSEKNLHHFSFEPSADLFTSRLKNQLPHYVPYHSDPGILVANVFAISWENFYAFPPFVIPEKCCESTEIVIAVTWPTQLWYNMV